jgi:hypothetical protein
MPLEQGPIRRFRMLGSVALKRRGIQRHLKLETLVAAAINEIVD